MPGKDFRFGISSSVAGLDVNKLLLAHPLSTYFMRVASDIPELDLKAEDILVIDRAVQPKANDIIVVAEPDDPDLKVVRFDKTVSEVQLWGVVVHLIRSMRP